MKRKRVLVVEDETDIRELVSYNLTKTGYDVVGVPTGEKALAAAKDTFFDLVILDIMLPGIDGLAVCEKLRAETKTATTPIIMLTAKGEESDIVTGLNLGADDYITKPFNLRELIARVQTVFRRTSSESEPTKQKENGLVGEAISVRDLLIHPQRHEVLIDGQPVDLSATEFRTLVLLAGRAGWVLTRKQILNGVHGKNHAITDRAVDVQIVGLRRKLGKAGEYIETVHGVGYRLKK